MKKIVCLGDSITYGYDASSKMRNYQQVPVPYPEYLSMLLGEEYEVINNGNVGWQARQTVNKLQELVFDYQPDICIIMLGINDSRGSRQGLMVSQKNYKNSIQIIIDQLKAQNIQIIFLTPTPVRFTRAKKFYEYSLELAKSNDLIFLDLYEKIYQQLALENQELSSILADNVHLNQEYYLLLAEWIYPLIIAN